MSNILKFENKKDNSISVQVLQNENVIKASDIAHNLYRVACYFAGESFRNELAFANKAVGAVLLCLAIF